MQSAYGWVGVSLPEPKRINQVVVYTVDSETHPAARYGVRELRLFCKVSNSATGMSNWREAQLRTGTSKNKSLIAGNRSGVVRFRIKPVITDGIRLLIQDTNDSKLVGRACTGKVRLVEIEAYGLKKKPKQEVVAASEAGIRVGE